MEDYLDYFTKDNIDDVNEVLEILKQYITDIDECIEKDNIELFTIKRLNFGLCFYFFDISKIHTTLCTKIIDRGFELRETLFPNVLELTEYWFYLCIIDNYEEGKINLLRRKKIVENIINEIEEKLF